MRRKFLLVFIFVFVFSPYVNAQNYRKNDDFVAQQYLLLPLMKTKFISIIFINGLQKNQAKKYLSNFFLQQELNEAEKMLMHKKQLAEKTNDIHFFKQRRSMPFISIYVAFILILVVSVFFFIYFRHQQRVKLKKLDIFKDREKTVQLERFLEGEENERKRIALELHDGISSELTIIRYALEVYKEKLPPEYTKDTDSLVKQVDKILESVRSISFNFAPPVFKEYSLSEAIRHFCERFSMIGDTTIAFQKYGKEPVISKKRKTAIYRIIQELVNNVRKHAESSDALVQVIYNPDTIHITVEDDGIGFNPRKTTLGLGLNNIKSRIEFLKARYHIDSSKKGTTFVFEVPVPQNLSKNNSVINTLKLE